MGAFVLTFLLAFGCGDLCRGEAVAHYARLFADAGYGRLPNERAGFLIRETGGTLTFAPWHHSDFASARYRGAVPANVIAVVHTHPSSASPWPSAHDARVARTLALPVIVVAKHAVTIATPDGATRELFGGRWFANRYSTASTP